MLGRRDDIQRSSSLQPRAHLEGLNIPASFKLPALHLVYEDAARRESHSSLYCNFIGPSAIMFYSARDEKERPTPAKNSIR